MKQKIKLGRIWAHTHTQTYILLIYWINFIIIIIQHDLKFLFIHNIVLYYILYIFIICSKILFFFFSRNTTSSNYTTIPTAKSLAQYNFINHHSSGAHTYMMTSDVGETTSTDSDIGTSPSGTTLASPPSSPQQIQQQQQQQPKSNKANNSIQQQQTSPSTNSIIRHHSYLNAVQLNDFKLNNLKSKFFVLFFFLSLSISFF